MLLCEKYLKNSAIFVSILTKVLDKIVFVLYNLYKYINAHCRNDAARNILQKENAFLPAESYIRFI